MKLFAAAVALTAFTACSDSDLAVDNSGVANPTDGQAMNTAVLTNASGQQISAVSGNAGTYYLNIKTDGIWYIETSDYYEFTPTRQYGRGNARVPMLIGNSYGDRQLTYQVHYLNEDGTEGGAARRAGEGQILTQTSNTDLEGFQKIVNSNIYVGYGFNPTSGGANTALWTGCEIFKMDSLNNTNLVKSSLSPETLESYIFSHSEKALDKIIGVSASPGGNFGPVRFDTLGVTVNTNNINHTGQTAMQKSLTRSIYSREINFTDATTNANSTFDASNLTPGFKRYKNQFIADLATAGADEAKQRAAADEFFTVVGTHVVVKSLLGQELNYRIVVDSSLTKKSTEVKVALDFKWQQQIKDTTSVDSATKARIKAMEEEWKNDPTKRKSFALKTGVEVTDAEYKAACSTNAKVKARGGDVELISILSTGGSLVDTDVHKWLLATYPEKAAMVGVKVLPIYYLFDKSSNAEKPAYDYLQNLIDTYLKVDEQMYGIITNKIE